MDHTPCEGQVLVDTVFSGPNVHLAEECNVSLGLFCKQQFACRTFQIPIADLEKFLKLVVISSLFESPIREKHHQVSI